MSEENHHDHKFMLGFFLGGLLGAITLFFVGTKEGKKAQKLISNKGEDFIDDLQGKLEELKKKGRELAEEGAELKDQVIEQMAEHKEDITHDVVKELDKTLSKIEEVQARGREVTEELRKKLSFKNLPKKS